MRPSFVLTGLLLLLAAIVPAARASTVQSASDPKSMCAGALKEMDPIELSLSADDAAIAGGSGVIHAHIHAWGDLNNARVSLVTEGPAQVAGGDVAIGTLVRGADYDFDIPVQLTVGQNAAVHFRVLADGSAGEHYTRNEGWYAVFRDGRANSGMGGFIYVALQGIQQDLALGRVTQADADAETHSLVALTPAIDHDLRPPMNGGLPAPGGPTPAELQPLLEGADGAQSAPDRRLVRGALQQVTGTITLQGTVNWQDENSTAHPCYGCQVELWNASGPSFISAVVTYTDGKYSLNTPGGGSPDLFVRVRAVNAQIGVRPSGGGAYYSTDGPTHSAVADNSTITDDFTFDNTGTNSCIGIQTAGSYACVFGYRLNGGSFLPFVPIEWPGGSGSDFNGSRIRLGTGDRWDWDVLHHEFGHFVQSQFNIANNPGGAHSSSSCDADARSSKDIGDRLAWGEGWPTFFGISEQNIYNLSSLGVPRVGDTFYQDFEDGSLQYDLEFQQPYGGEDNERAVMNTFWDLWDNHDDGRDHISVSDLTLFDRINAADPGTLSAAWAALRAPLSNADQLLYGGCAADHLIGPTLKTPAAAFILSPSNFGGTSFSWDARVGCGTIGPGDNFDLVFYKNSDKSKILTIGGLGTTSHTLTAGEFATLVGAAHDCLWAVEGRSTASPATGPYLGENFQITVDRPPVANAGPDQLNVECASHTTTDVNLDGSASSDPDGDALTYTWSATGVTFNDAHAAKPVGHFHEGTTVVTLEVSDGFMTDTDQMTVKVVDTTPPTITCPASITVECTQSGGTPATDPAIVAFLAGASATDICDPSPTLGNNAPSFFPHGTTPVKFTATDADLNKSDCTANVKVQDTTPPTISVSLDRTALWPPNHKLSDIHATVTVTDICDPNPYFVLTSITSNEPIDGLGDGDTAPDWVGADLGTADTDFQLRSERGGIGTGRVYTITYTAYDWDGNHASASVTVTVAHDLTGSALASDGFLEDGTGFLPGAQEFAMVVPTTGPNVGDVPVSGYTGADGAGSVDPGTLAVDASELDLPHAYVGNSRGAIAPLRTEMVDVNGDGLADAVCFYDVAAVKALKAASLLDDGPVGLHYVTNDRRSFLLPDVFTAGQPVALPVISTAANAAHAGSAAAQPGGAAAGSADGSAVEASRTGARMQAPKYAPTPVALPVRTRLSGVYPNPFQHEAVVAFDLASSANVSLEVYDLRGARIARLASGWRPAGRYQMGWDGRDGSGRAMAGGVYLIRFTAGNYVSRLKVTLAR